MVENIFILDGEHVEIVEMGGNAPPPQKKFVCLFMLCFFFSFLQLLLGM